MDRRGDATEHNRLIYLRSVCHRFLRAGFLPSESEEEL